MRVLSGMRPSGRLHLGNYWGALKKWLELQEKEECFFMVADWHGLTTEYQNTKNLRTLVEEMVLDWLAAGLDPQRAVIFQQSRVPEHAELALLLSMITPLGWLERNPTYKEQLQELPDRDISTHGFLGYPVLQAADILIYKATGVPVGEDQLPHVELTREIARRFNHLYSPVFPEPQAILSPTPKVPGVDARKMSKSYGNTLGFTENPKTVEKRVSQMFTDPQKIRASDLGHPEGCVVFAFHRLYNASWSKREHECREGLIGCVACKKDLNGILGQALAGFQTKRKEFDHKRELVEKILTEGSGRARGVAVQTLSQVRHAMGLA